MTPRVLPPERMIWPRLDGDGVAFVAQRSVGADGKATAARLAGLDVERRAGHLLDPVLELGGGIGFLRRRVIGELDAALRLARLDHLHLAPPACLAV